MKIVNDRFFCYRTDALIIFIGPMNEQKPFKRVFILLSKKSDDIIKVYLSYMFVYKMNLTVLIQLSFI